MPFKVRIEVGVRQRRLDYLQHAGIRKGAFEKYVPCRGYLHQEFCHGVACVRQVVNQ